MRRHQKAESRHLSRPASVFQSETGRSEIAVAAVTAAGGGFLLLRLLGDERLGRQEEARNAGRVLQSGTNHLGRVDDAVRDEVRVFVRLRVVPEGALTLAH